ncbi:hypothetical protein Xhom_05027 [Xenorhabdus hominickii]|uniref:Uncharacterized protein n=1 Tax=Xenorhabdus hominickii TaxID=351679 RepID=A0A2G0PP54_XENHO|nr:hypothetical protein Xhom_05027 [Xenorhabdus hominickii]
MQHINVRVLVVDGVSQLFDFGCLVVVDFLLFLILGAVMVASECSYTRNANQSHDRVVDCAEFHDKNICCSDALRLVSPFITLPAALSHRENSSAAPA